MLDIIFKFIGIGTVIYWIGVLGVKIIKRTRVVYHNNNETVSEENEKEIKVVKKETKKKTTKQTEKESAKKTVDKKENKTTTKKSTAKKPKTKEKE